MIKTSVGACAANDRRISRVRFLKKGGNQYACDRSNFSNTIESIVRKVEDRCPECGSEQYVWQQKIKMAQNVVLQLVGRVGIKC